MAIIPETSIDNEADYILTSDSAWVTVKSPDGTGDLSVYIRRLPEGVKVEVYAKDAEDVDPLATTVTMWKEAKETTDAIKEGR